ncbi:hypothetical protein Tsubulata_051396 [Turnera subulata]|uniref:DUF4283 domain-containing protein n=1 Tax=Turnera subulata TaxID=218843 RepID=A0A9Q0JB73_9ROSI|nr:hypothetical protein Tsubulata_051396 [Turnera subulata]
MATSSNELGREQSNSVDQLPIPVLELCSDDDESSSCVSPVLVDTLFAHFRRFSAKTIGEALNRAWSLTTLVEIKEAKDNVFVFTFASIAEKERILQGSPWNFSGFMLCLKEWPSSVSLRDLKFDEASIWVQERDEAGGSQCYGEARSQSPFYPSPLITLMFRWRTTVLSLDA